MPTLIKKGEDGGRKFRINKHNIEILSNVEESNNYDGILGQYLKAIYEEYAQKPNYIREQIFFADNLEEINKGIKEQKNLKFFYQKINHLKSCHIKLFKVKQILITTL